MKRQPVFAFLAVALLAGAARADILPDGHKGVKLSIRVDAEVPAGKALILAHTFRAIDVIQPGTVAQVEWHPMGGQMVIMTVPATSLTSKVEEQRKSLEREPLEAIAKGGTPCHGGFDGVRTVPISAPADEVRWNYKVTFSGDACTATLAKMEFFDKTGKPVEGTDVPGVPSSAAAAPPPTGSAAGTAAQTASPATSAAGSTPGEVPKGACGCEIGPGARTGGAGTGLFAALGFFLAASRRRKGRASPAKDR